MGTKKVRRGTVGESKDRGEKEQQQQQELKGREEMRKGKMKEYETEKKNQDQAIYKG